MGNSRKTRLYLVGQFLGYELKKHKIHRVHIRQGQEEFSLKVGRDARQFLVRAYLEETLQVGDWLEVTGVRKEHPEKGIKLKAQLLDYATRPEGAAPEIASSSPAHSNTASSGATKTKVLVCQKSGCCKRGGKAVMEQLQKVVGDRDLAEHVLIKATGCMGKCKQGPVMVIDKTHYRQVAAKNISRLVAHHVKP